MLEIAALVVVKKFRKMNARWRFPKFARALTDDLSLTSIRVSIIDILSIGIDFGIFVLNPKYQNNR